MKERRTYFRQFRFLLIAQEDNVKVLMRIENHAKNPSDFFGQSSICTKLRFEAERHTALSL